MKKPWEMTHKELYPHQYTHSLCGKNVVVIQGGRELARGKVERVIQSRFGPIAMFEGNNIEGYAVGDCKVIS
jgi:hypothetical protein